MLVSGFGPYEGISVNPSYEVPKALCEHGLVSADSRYDEALQGADVRISTVNLPVSFAKAWPLLLEAIENTDSNIVVATGLKHDARGILLERCATNLIDTVKPDVDNAQPRRTPIDEDGPAAYWTKLPLRSILRDFTEDEICSSLSSDAGTFVCNALFYSLQHWTAMHEHVLSGFISFPKIVDSKSKEHGLPMDQQVAAGRDVVCETIRYYRQPSSGDILLA